MKLRGMLCTVCVCCALCWAQSSEQQSSTTGPQPKLSKVLPNPAFDRIKSLEGEWEGTYDGKIPARATFKIMGAGSTVLQILPGEKPRDEMVSVFHPDKTDLLLTHYCSSRNAPRMKLEPSSNPDVLKFTFLDVTNLTGADDGHMVEVALTFDGHDKHTEVWTWLQDGKRDTATFELTRKK